MYSNCEFFCNTDSGDTVLVEVYYEFIEADPYAVSSDWDYKGGWSLDVISVTKDGQPYKDFLPEEYIYRELVRYLREESIQDAIYNNINF